MSLFDQNSNNNAPVEGQPAAGNEEVSYLEQYVGEDKKWKDPEGVAKGYYHLELHAKTLEEENKQLRQDRDSRLALEELVKELREKSGVSNQNNSDGERPNYEHQSNTPNEPVDLAQAVRQILQQEQAQTQYQRNVESCVSELQNEYGSGYMTVLSNRQAELGLSKEAMDKMAGESPKAFLALVKGSRPTQSFDNAAPPRNAVNSAALPRGNAKDWNYYKQMRKENPSRYYSGEIQREMFTAIENGTLVPGQ